MQLANHPVNIGIDTVWLEDIRFLELRIIRDETPGFLMENGGISTKAFSSLKNIMNVIGMARKVTKQGSNNKNIFAFIFVKSSSKVI